MRNTVIFLFISVAIGFFSCSTNEDTTSGKIRVVATTGMIGDALVNILDTMAEVKTLMGPGVDPHLYKATQGDLSRLNNADIIVYNGLHLEGKMVEILGRLKEKRTCIALEDIIKADDLIPAEGFENTYDPHIWFDVELWKNSITSLGQLLADTLPQFKEVINTNTKTYIEKLIDLQLATENKMSAIPEDRRILVTAHDAFEYFGRAYDIEVRGLQGISTLSEAGIKDITDMVDYLVENKIPAVFVETSVSRRSINAVVEGCKRKGHEIVIGGKLYSDALGEAGTSEGTYIGTVNWNVETIVNALSQ